MSEPRPALAGGQYHAHGAGDGQGDTGGGLQRPARGCGGDDTEAAGGEELGREANHGAGALAGEVPGGVRSGPHFLSY